MVFMRQYQQNAHQNDLKQLEGRNEANQNEITIKLELQVK